MEQEQGNTPAGSGEPTPNVMEPVRTVSVTDASIRPPRVDSPLPRPATVPPGPVAPHAVAARPSTFLGDRGGHSQTRTPGVDARWPLTLLALLVAGIVIGALVGSVLAVIAFP
ncbi:MAG: hypothetical protein OXG46_02080 [Chloroflexi bacterium]|nr:hypothetical protein [Chloroflexota bacterium]MCY3937198.1 hypothetical protein [Chloroflexota bacterium]